MADTTEAGSNAEVRPATFLCVVDDSAELSQALQFACRRVMRIGGRLALLYVTEPAEFQHWASVGELMREERRQEAEEMLSVVSAVVAGRIGQAPITYIREGQMLEELLKVIEEEQINYLVLGAATGPDGPGPLVSQLIQKMAGRLPIPVVVVPGSLSEEQINRIA